MATTGAPYRVALTFDAEHPDRPTDPEAELRLLEAVGRLDLRATFFLQGRWVEAYPERARAIAEGGHLVGNHGHYHVRMPLLSDPGLGTDIASSEEVIRATTGVDPKPWFRCPFGAGFDDERVLAGVRAAGYRHVHWDVEPEDWLPELTGDLVASRVLEGVRARHETGTGDGTIVLLHSWPTGTADGIEAMVGGLRDAGAELVRLDDLEPASEARSSARELA